MFFWDPLQRTFNSFEDETQDSDGTENNTKVTTFNSFEDETELFEKEFKNNENLSIPLRMKPFK